MLETWIRRTGSALIAFTLYGAAPASQGSPRALAGYWESLSRSSSVAEANAIAPPSNSDRYRDGDIARGLLLLRQYELTYVRADASRSVRALERVADLVPNDAWAHFALGAALARGPDVRMRPYAESSVYIIHSTKTLAALRAPRELRRALQLDPTLDAAAIELAQLAIDMSDPALMREAASKLDAANAPQDADVLTSRAKLLNRMGRSAEAAQLTDAAQRAGYDASLASHDRAIVEFRRKGAQEVAAAAYFEGVDMLTPRGAAAYFADLELLVTKDERAAWLRADNEQRKVWLRYYWDRHSALSGVTVADRLAEHYRRLASIPRVAASARNDTAEFRGGMRPTLRETSASVLNAVRYGKGDRGQQYLYCAPGWDTLPAPLQPTSGQCKCTPYGRMRSRQVGTAVCGVIYARGNNLPIIAALEAKLHPPLDETDRAAGRALQRIANERSVEGEAYYPSYARHLALAWQAFQFRATEGGSQVVAAVALPYASAVVLRNTDGVLDVTMMLSLVDTTADWVRRESAYRQLRADAITPASLVLLSVAARAPAGRAVPVRVSVENADASAGRIARGTIDIDSFDPDSLSMSDIVIAPPDLDGTFVRGDVSVALAPARSYRTSETPRMYYELYGTSAGDSIDTEVSIEPVRASRVDRLRSLFGRDDGRVTLRFGDIAGAAHATFGVQQTRSLGLEALSPGSYVIRVTVTDRTQRRATQRETTLTIEPVAR